MNNANTLQPESGLHMVGVEVSTGNVNKFKLEVFHSDLF